MNDKCCEIRSKLVREADEEYKAALFYRKVASELNQLDIPSLNISVVMLRKIANDESQHESLLREILDALYVNCDCSAPLPGEALESDYRKLVAQAEMKDPDNAVVAEANRILDSMTDWKTDMRQIEALEDELKEILNTEPEKEYILEFYSGNVRRWKGKKSDFLQLPIKSIKEA